MGAPRLAIAFLVVAAIFCGSLLGGETLVERKESSTDQAQNLRGASSPFSLFDPSRFQMSHSYSISFFSGGGQSNTIAMYLNRMDYDLTDNMRLSVQLGWLHQPQAALGLSRQTISDRIYPSVRFDWRPSSNFHLQFNYETLSPYSSGYLQRPYGYYPYWERRTVNEREAEDELQE